MLRYESDMVKIVCVGYCSVGVAAIWSVLVHNILKICAGIEFSIVTLHSGS